MSTPAALHRVIICVDIERFSDPGRIDPSRLAMRQGLYGSLERAFAKSKIPWDECYHEDRGDGVFVLVPQDVPPVRLIEPLPFELAAELGRHNQTADVEIGIRLRVALHAGYVRRDPEGVVGTSVNQAFRLLDAPELREALKDAPGDLAFIASEEFARDVIRQRRGFDPATYRAVRVTNKQTEIDAWIWTSDVQLRAGREYGERVIRIKAVLASIDETLATARTDRAVTGEKISSPLPDVADLAGGLRDRLAALAKPRKKRRWSELVTEVAELERAANASLDEAHVICSAVRAPLERREELRGLLEVYQVMAREHGRAEDPRCDELYRRARDLLWTAPCDLVAAESATMRYTRAIQEG